MVRSTLNIALSAVILLLAGLVAGCDDRSSPAGSSAKTPSPRIVSLSPALSRTLEDFGLEESIVGRSRYCENLDQSIPVVGDLRDINFEMLLRIDPTHIVVQPEAAGVNPQLRKMGENHDWTLGAWRLDSIDDIKTVVRELPGFIFPDKSPQREQLTRRAAEMHNRIATAMSPMIQKNRPDPTLLVCFTEPVTVFGQDTYLHDVLVALGGANATSRTGWAELSLESLLRLDPPAIIFVSPGLESSVDPIEAIGPIGTLDIAAVREERVAVLSHPGAFLPSTSVIEVAEEMRTILEKWNSPEIGIHQGK